MANELRDRLDLDQPPVDAEGFIEALDRTAAADALILQFYEGHKAQFAT